MAEGKGGTQRGGVCMLMVPHASFNGPGAKPVCAYIRVHINLARLSCLVGPCCHNIALLIPII